MIKLEQIRMSLIACSYGDALGLPTEGLYNGRGRLMFPNPDRFYLLGHYGSTSDDYDHACMTVEAFLVANGNVTHFQKELAERIKWWSLCIPGGIGLATLRSSIKLWLRCSPTKSGVFSAGNGPAMRSHILGTLATDMEHLKNLVCASTQISHTDPKALNGALVVAIASRCSSLGITTGIEFLNELKHAFIGMPVDTTFLDTINLVVQSVIQQETTEAYCARFYKNGVSGYMYNTVPAVIHAWLSHPLNVKHAVQAVISCGGDTDTTGSIVGGIVGASPKVVSDPSLTRNLILWPRNLNYIENLVMTPVKPKIHAWQYLCRNVWFNVVVLIHGLLRFVRS